MTDRLLQLAREAARRAYAPFSGAPAAAALADRAGRWLAAPRVESASFPLSVPALQGSWALASVAGLRPERLVLSRPPSDEDAAFVAATWPHLDRVGDAFASDGEVAELRAEPVSLLRNGEPDDEAVRAAERAVVPASGFRVGAAVRDVRGRTVIGANVEHPSDWTRGLCAERVALVAAQAAGLGPIQTVSVACVAAPGGSPCGGCRQLLAERAPDATIRIWGGDSVRETTAAALLPDAFVGDGLRA